MRKTAPAKSLGEVYMLLEAILSKYNKADLTEEHKDILFSAIHSAWDSCRSLKDYLSPTMSHGELAASWKSLVVYADKLVPQIAVLLRDTRSLDKAHEALLEIQQEKKSDKRKFDKNSTILPFQSAYMLLSTLQSNLIAGKVLAEVVLSIKVKPGSTMNYRMIPVLLLAEAWHKITGLLPGTSQQVEGKKRKGPFVEFVTIFFEATKYQAPDVYTIRGYLKEINPTLDPRRIKARRAKG